MRSNKLISCGLAIGVGVMVAFSPCPAPAYIDYPPLTLGSLCGSKDCTHIFSVSVEKVDKEKNRVFFRKLAEFKGKHPAVVICLAIPPDSPEGRRVLEWAEPGKKTVMFFREGKPKTGWPHINYVYIDSLWFFMHGEDETWKLWTRFAPTPLQLRTYCGRSDKLVEAVAAILAGKEAVVPCMTNGSSEELRRGKTKVQRVKTKLNDVEWDGKLKTTFVGWGYDDDNKPAK